MKAWIRHHHGLEPRHQHQGLDRTDESVQPSPRATAFFDLLYDQTGAPLAGVFAIDRHDTRGHLL
jgi:hypothetical protein